MSSTKAPSFESEVYWEHRFTVSQTPFEWLTSIDDTTRILDQVIGSRDRVQDPKILHIGCGTSDLALALRRYVKWPSNVHNVDFSQRAVDCGQARERECFGNTDTHLTDAKEEARTAETGINPSWMRWSKVDLLSFPSVLSLVNRKSDLYDWIIDKSTSDAIACGEDITVQSMSTYSVHPPLVSLSMHPVEVLAVHLAAVTTTDGRWVSISYCADRFWFLEPKRQDDLPTVRSDVPDVEPQSGTGQRISRLFEPAGYWRLERKEHIPVAGFGGATNTDEPVHRPQIHHWLYVSARTNTPVAGLHFPAAPVASTASL